MLTGCSWPHVLDHSKCFCLALDVSEGAGVVGRSEQAFKVRIHCAPNYGRRSNISGAWIKSAWGSLGPGLCHTVPVYWLCLSTLWASNPYRAGPVISQCPFFLATPFGRAREGPDVDELARQSGQQQPQQLAWYRRGQAGDPKMLVLLRRAWVWGVSTQLNTVKLHGLMLLRDLWPEGVGLKFTWKKRAFSQRRKRGVWWGL